MTGKKSEDELLRSVALQNASSILRVRQRAEEELFLAKEALRESHERMTQVLESITEGFVVLDSEWRVTYLNPRGEEILRPLRKTRASLMGLNHWEEFPESVGTPIEEAYRRAVRENVATKVEIFYPPLDVWFDIRAYPSLAGLSVFFQDITLRKEAEALLEAERNVLNMVASDRPLAEILEGIAKEIESRSIAGMRARVAPDGTVTTTYARGRKPGSGDQRLVTLAHDMAAIAIARQLSAEALRESEEQLRAMFEQAAVGIASAGPDGRFQQPNRKFCELLGYTPEEMHGKTFLDITHPDDVEATRAQVALVQSGQQPAYRMEKRYVRRDGSTFWSTVSVTLLRDAAGKPLRYIGVIEDITARKETEEALVRSERKMRESEGDLRRLANTIPHLAWMAEPDGNIFWYNERWYEYTGTSIESMAGWGWQSVHDPGILPTVVERWSASIASGDPFDMEFPLRGADGVFRWFLTRVNPMRDINGQVVRWFGTNTDIDDVRRIRQALVEETRMLELLNETGRTLASNLELQALLQAVTDSATKLSGAEFGAFFYNVAGDEGEALHLYTLSGAPREAFDSFGHPRATPIFAPTFRGEGIVRIANVQEDPRYGQMGPHHGMPRGHLPVCSYLAVPVKSRSGEVIGGLFFGHGKAGVFGERSERLVGGIAAQASVAIDNARLFEAAQRAARDREELLESERHARAEAERASHMKDEFLATLSHELRTPLSAILGWSHLMRARAPGPEELAKGLEIVERNARLQVQLIEDLLDMSRITSGKLRLDVQPVMPLAFIEAAIETVRPAAEAKDIRLERVLDPAAGPISGDPARLQQVLWNLLNNAIKFTPRGGKVQVALARINSHVEISVSDNGAGIGPEFLAHVFERFRQADASTTRRFGGLGLGLSIVKSLVELHGGTVRVTSAGESQGSTFVVELPLCAVHRSTAAEGRVHPRAQGPVAKEFAVVDLTGVKVLVVDDQPDTCELVARVLVECGATVVTASGAAEALALLQEARPDVLLSDIGMPDMDGYELLQHVRALPPDRGGRTPAVAMTAFARSEDRTRALRAGFQVHVAKPVEPSELVATVASVAGRTIR